MADAVPPKVDPATRDAVTRIARDSVGRADTQGYKGRRRSDAALEFLVGAVSALGAVGDNRTQSALSTLAFLVASRGMGPLNDYAARPLTDEVPAHG
jgi:hypothetical protein